MLSRLRRLLPTPEAVRNNRWLRWLGPALHHPRLFHMCRRGVATGTAIGVFFAFITPVAQIPLSAAVSMVLRANIPAAIAGTLVNTPPTFGPVYYGAWRVGSWLLREDVSDADTPAALKTAPSAAPAAGAADTPAPERNFLQRSWATLQDIGKPLLLGALVFSVVFSALAYAIVNALWHLRVRLKRRSRLRARRPRQL